jgi:hypothetical protein
MTSTSGHGDPDVYRMTVAERFRHCYGLELPTRKRQCLYGSPFPCNGHCAMQLPRMCLQAELVRQEEAS